MTNKTLKMFNWKKKKLQWNKAYIYNQTEEKLQWIGEVDYSGPSYYCYVGEKNVLFVKYDNKIEVYFNLDNSHFNILEAKCNNDFRSYNNRYLGNSFIREELALETLNYLFEA